ncbi:MAG: M81 family metallopeptidase [Sphaerochaeta sp.]
MKKRVLVGGLHHESDTFNPIVTSKDDIWVYRGQQLIEHKDASSISGAIKTLLDAGYEVVPTLIARAVPNGEWDKDYYLSLKNELLEVIKKEKDDLDAICLSLHGSMRVKDIGEAEGDLLEAIREILPHILIISSLDMHATVTKRMIDNCDGYVGYKCAPHTDTYETGVSAAKMTIECLENNFIPKMSAVHIPFIVAGEQSETSVEPMKSYTDLLRKEELDESLMSCSILLGFPWADTEENGVTALVVAKDSQLAADKKAMELAETFWNRRAEFGFYNETRGPEDTLVATKESIDKGLYPVVISDSGDNPTAGSSGDVTNFLHLLLKDEELKNVKPPVAYQAFYDKDVVSLAMKSGIGSVIESELGAKYDTVKSAPVIIKSKVKAICKNFEAAEGCDVVLLDVEGIDVLVTNKHVGCYDPKMLEAVGINPEENKVIIVKLGYLEPEIRKIAKRSIMALTDGSSDELFERLPYEKMKRPVYPLDGDFEAKLEYIK